MKKPSILIIDDDSEIHKSLFLIFEDEHYVFTASNGRDGLGIIERNNISLIILDLQMPKMNGLEFLQCIRKVNEDIPVLIIAMNGQRGAPTLMFRGILKNLMISMHWQVG